MGTAAPWAARRFGRAGPCPISCPLRRMDVRGVQPAMGWDDCSTRKRDKVDRSDLLARTQLFVYL